MLEQWIQEGKQDVIEWYRHLHQYPELSFQEEQTANYVWDILESFGNLQLSRPTPNSIMARLIGPKPGKIIALRADMDALPILEENEFAHKSQHPGVMHACGHDGHTATLLGAVQVLSRYQSELAGEIRFLFQHAEEKFPGGAQEMVDQGVMDGVDYVIGNHFDSQLETGKISVTYGPMMAAPDTFEIEIIGKGGHAAAPHECIDPIAIGAEVISSLQKVVSRRRDPLDPMVVSVTKVSAGTTDNVIPSTMHMMGTVRTYSEELRTLAPVWMEQTIQGITQAYDAEYHFSYRQGYRPVINDEWVTNQMEEVICTHLEAEKLCFGTPQMGGEDFSAYLTKAPGTFFNVGSGNKEKGTDFPHHHPRFSLDEEAFQDAVAMFVFGAINLSRS